MKKLSPNKKAFIALSACIIILTSIKFNNYQYSPKISYNDKYNPGSEEPFGTYRKGNIYIGDQEFIDRIFDESTDDVYVVDLRNMDNFRYEDGTSSRRGISSEISSSSKSTTKYINLEDSKI